MKYDNNLTSEEKLKMRFTYIILALIVSVSGLLIWKDKIETGTALLFSVLTFLSESPAQMTRRAVSQSDEPPILPSHRGYAE